MGKLIFIEILGFSKDSRIEILENSGTSIMQEEKKKAKLQGMLEVSYFKKCVHARAVRALEGGCAEGLL